MKFYDLLSEATRQEWPQIYHKLTGKKWKQDKKDERGITTEVQLENLEEIDKIMRQVPNPTKR